MDSKTFSSSFNFIPEAITGGVEMLTPNQPINVYKGNYILKSAETGFEIRIDGTITFKWLPEPIINFSGTCILDTNILVSGTRDLDMLRIVVDGIVMGNVFKVRIKQIDKGVQCNIRGSMSGIIVNGDRSIEVQKINFSIPNFKSLSGLPLKKSSELRLYKGRIFLESDEHQIFIDKIFDHDTKQELLEVSGGYIIQYNGEIIFKKGKINHDSLQKTIYRLNIFLSFISGRQTAACFIQGIFDDEIIWTSYPPFVFDAFQNVQSWCDEQSTNGITATWTKYLELCKTKENMNFLSTVIKWYVEANRKSVFLHAAIIMSQTAMELLYNWLIVENRKMLIGRDAENISASGKIRLLLSQLNIQTEIPDSLKYLKKWVSTDQGIKDAPDAIVQVRNAIVHSQLEQRTKLATMGKQEMNEALQLCLWYIELSLLYIIGYDDIYCNRCFKWADKDTDKQLVPWSTKLVKQPLPVS